MAKKKKGNSIGRHIISIGIFTVLGVILGLSMTAFVEWQLPEGISPGEKIMRLLSMLVFLYGSWFIHLVIHEAGHLVFGLASGYQFSSFRVGSRMLLKENGKLVHKKLTIAGTGGQCLMAPPEMIDGKFPVVAYNLGGSIMNLIVSALFLGLYFVLDKGGYLVLFCFMMVAMGVLTGLSNGIPLRTGTVDNDGYNAMSLAKSRDAMRAFWIQMKVNERISKGLRLKDMPEEWFEMPSDEAMKNNMVAAIGVFTCNRLMDEQRFDEAEERMKHLLEIESGIIGLHRNLVVCDLIYLELIGENRSDVLNAYYTAEQKKFMKEMKTFPSVIRTEYVYAILGEKDTQKAAKAMETFEKTAKTYPYPNEILSERELIDIADNLVLSE